MHPDQRTLDACSSCFGILVFPHSNNRPAGRDKPFRRLLVTDTSSLNLRPPEVAVVAWPGHMIGTTVPEATVDKNGDTCLRKHDVGAAPQRMFRCQINAEPVATAMKD